MKKFSVWDSRSWLTGLGGVDDADAELGIFLGEARVDVDDQSILELDGCANCIAQLLPHQWQTVQFAPPTHRYIHMVFLAITPAGLADALRTAKADEAIWCGSDAMTEADYKALDRPHVSRFTYELGDRELIPDAIGTMRRASPR